MNSAVKVGERCRRLWQGLPGGSRTLLVSVVVLTLALALTYNCLFTADWSTVAGRYDIYRAVGPISYYLDYTIQHGELPLWNPLTFCGMPCAANPIAALFYPPNLIRSLLSFNPTPFKTQFGWIVLMALHLLLAGTGMVFLARDHKLSYGASLVAACVFIFSAIWVRRICEYHFITMVGWLPLMLLLTRRGLLKNRITDKFRYGLLCGLFFGMSLLAGGINIAPYMGIVLGSYAFFHRLVHLGREERGRAGGFFRMLGGDVVFMAALGVVTVLAGMALLLPGLELAGFSSRGKDTGYKMASPVFRGSWRDLYRMLIRYPGMKWSPENIRGAGIGAMLLVLAGLSHRRWRELAVYLALALVLFDCSMGKPWSMATLIDWANPISMVSSTRAFDFALIPLAIIAGFGVDAITARGKSWWWMLISVALVLFGALFLRSLAPLIGPNTFIPVSNWALIVPAVTVAVIALGAWLPGKWLWRALIVALVFGETLVWNHRYVPEMILKNNFARWAGVYAGDDPFWPDNRRGTDPIVNRHLYALDPAINGYEPVHVGRVRTVIASDARLRTYHRLVYDKETTQDNHRGNLFLKRSFWLARQYVEGPLRSKALVFPPTTTVFLEDADGLPVPQVEARAVPVRCVSQAAEEIHFADVAQLQAFRRQVKSGGIKRTFVIRHIKGPGVHSAFCLRFSNTQRVTVESQFTDVETGVSELGKTAIIGPRVGRDIVLEIPMPDYDSFQVRMTMTVTSARTEIDLKDVYVVADRNDEDAHIRILSRRANSVTVELRDLPDYRILTHLDAAFPGWKAYVDDEEVPIYLANDAFKAIVAPPGTHTIRFVFRPWRVYAGVTISVLTAIGVIAVFAGLGRKQRPA